MTFLSVKEHTLKKRKNRKDNENINGGGDDHNDNDNELPHSHNLKHTRPTETYTQRICYNKIYIQMYIGGQKTYRNKKNLYTFRTVFEKTHKHHTKNATKVK